MSHATLSPRARLLVSCPDRPGIIAAVTRFLFEHEANILDLDQHATSPGPGLFFLRLELELAGLEGRLEALRAGFEEVAHRFRMDWRLTDAARRQRLAIFVSKEDHCLQELLWQLRSGDLCAEVALVVGNHPELAQVVAPYGIPFHHVPVSAATRAQATATHLELLEGKVDLVVLARYMQILPPELCRRWSNQIINIHHSFLPAFVGANPYAQAWERGVKLIGATAHYVTADLDAGPIIEQDVYRVGHRHDVEDLRRAGRELERSVLARAVTWHLEDRVLVHGNKTLVFR